MREVSFWQMMSSHDVRIPIIQRDYAQGRTSDAVSSVRERFLRNLHEACYSGSPLLLDFIYGEESHSVLLPFDGQQRLTTLFLLHWYAAARRGVLEGAVAGQLAKFRYHVREGARLFGQELVTRGIPETHPVRLAYDAKSHKALSAYIQDQAWFRAEWQFDPTISGMLTMLDAIHKWFHALDDLWEKLTADRPPVTFNFEALSGLALSADETFIKMNARGKQLTDFEHFKARFVDQLTQHGIADVSAIARKFDNQWTDLFWASFADAGDDSEDKAEKSDRCFMAYLHFIADIFINWPTDDSTAESTQSMPQCDENDLFECLSTALHTDRMRIQTGGDIAFLVNTLDKLVACATTAPAYKGIDAFFNRYFVVATANSLPVPGKISLFTESDISTNLFAKCCTAAQFSQADRLLFFACLLVLLADMDPVSASPRLRALRNILENSANELRDEFFSDQLREVPALILNGLFAEKTRFNTHQVAEERTKMRLRLDQPDDVELQNALDYIEDHPLLRGRLAIFSQDDATGLPPAFTREDIVLGKRFWASAFGVELVDYDAVIRGLLSQRDYAYRAGPQRLYLGKANANAGKLSRRDIFTTLDRRSFSACREAVQSLAAQTQAQGGAGGLEKKLHEIADSWVEECQRKKAMDWRYYFTKYAAMRPHDGESSLYFWGYSRQSFNQLKLAGSTRLSQNWSPFLWAAVVEAGFAENDDYSGVDSWGQETNPLLFPWCNLALWWSEFSWHIGSPARNRKLGPKQSDYLDQLRRMFSEIDESGWWHIPGEDSEQGIDYANFENHHFRLHDTTDRIALVVPLIKAIYGLRNHSKE